MANKPVQAAAEGVPSLIAVHDQLGVAQAFATLLGYALDSMALGGSAEVNAVQYGISQVSKEIDRAQAMIEEIREARR